jgi:hypothetical protein
MVRIIHESLDAAVNVFLKEKRTGTILIDDQGLQAGREVSGNTQALMDNYSKKRII